MQPCLHCLTLKFRRVAVCVTASIWIPRDYIFMDSSDVSVWGAPPSQVERKGGWGRMGAPIHAADKGLHCMAEWRLVCVLKPFVTNLLNVWWRRLNERLSQKFMGRHIRRGFAVHVRVEAIRRINCSLRTLFHHYNTGVFLKTPKQDQKRKRTKCVQRRRTDMLVQLWCTLESHTHTHACTEMKRGSP